MSDDGGCVKEIRELGRDVVVVLTGAVDMHRAPNVHKTLLAACDQRPGRLVVNLTEVSYMDSSGIGTLVDVFRRVKAYQGKLALCWLNERVHSVFEITKLDKFFRIFATESEAMTA